MPKETGNKNKKFPNVLFIIFIVCIILFISAFLIYPYSTLSDSYRKSEKALDRYVAIKLNKMPEQLTEEDYLEIKILNLDSRTYSNLGPLRKFKNLRNLTLSYITIESLKPLSGLQKLETLKIDNLHSAPSKFTQLILKNGFMRKIMIKNISKTLTVNINPLGKLTKLRELTITSTPLYNINALSKLESLDSLELAGTGITNIELLSRINRLRELRLSEQNITSIKPLKGFTNLTSLSLYCDNVEDFSPVKNMINLKDLTIKSENINSEQISEIRKELPYVK